jgi:RNA polymerase sigma-70 factor (ECF subfamily)
VIRKRLHPKLRPKYDSEDFCQAVWASFFADRGAFARFKSAADLTEFLGGVAGNKVVDEVRRRLMGQKFNVNRECSFQDTGNEHALSAKSPTPSQLVVAHEQYDRLLDGRSQKHQMIVKLRADGLTYQDIARQIDMNERNVRKVIERIERRVQR